MGSHTLFTAGCFGLDITPFCNCIPQSRPVAGFWAFLTNFFSLPHAEDKDLIIIIIKI